MRIARFLLIPAAEPVCS